MKNSEQVSFEMIAKNGAARSLFLEAIQEAKKGKYKEARRLMEDGEALIVEGHIIHGNLITQFALGEHVEMDLLLVHAEDQMMAAEMFKLLAREFIEIYEKINE